MMQIEFVSPEDILYSGEGTQVVARTRGGGEIAFLTGHEPFIGSLVPCEIRVTESGGDIKRFAVRGGFVSVTGVKVTVLSDAAIAAADINVAAVRAELAKAQAAEQAAPDDPLTREDRQWAEVRLVTAGVAVEAAH
ncbi:MAG: ATP synthase F1 subunit epsilon [Acidimicrobiia bacterium]|nr:ATP synthase F1 subunit epsilon [Acidimicrobiia bacterium]